MKNKVISSFILLTLISSLLSCNVFATETVELPVESEDVVTIIEPSEEEIKEEQARNNLEAFKETFNKNLVKPDGVSNITVVEISVPLEEQDPNSEELATRNVLYFGEHDSLVYFGVEDLEFKLWVEEVADKVSEDALIGLKALKDATVTIDHIKLSKWGEFFNAYYGKTKDDFPIGDIVLEYDDYRFVFNNTKEAKELFINYFIPPLIERIEEEAKAYPAKRYALDVKDGALLKDYVCDLTSVREVETVYPFDNVDNHIFYNAGSYYCMSLGKDYVDILRGYIEDGESSYNRRVEGEVPGCVNVLSYITLLSNVSGNTVSDKVLTDFTLYQNLAIRLDTKELIDVEDMSTDIKKLYYADYKLNEDNLIIAPIKNDVVVVQPTYLECFFYKGFNKGLGRLLDVTDFVQTGDPNLTYVVDGQKYKIPIEYFCTENGTLDIKLGQAPFLIYYTNHVPYDLMINWAYNQSSGHFASEEERDAFVDLIREDMDKLGRSSDFDSYIKAAGQMTDGVKTIIKVAIGAVVLILVLIIVFVIKKKLKEEENDYNGNRSHKSSNVLFGDDDDDDDDDGGFELK